MIHRLLLVGLVGSLLHAESSSPLLNHGNTRIVLVGDSITGLSRNESFGFAHQMDWALRQVYPGCKLDIIALGGSGQGVSSWAGVEQRSRTEELFLDVKGIPVKQTLDQHADVLVIMLGMNDVLAPYVLDEPESLQKWTDTYRELIKSLQARLTPKVTALATPTLCTEDIHSPKNRMMDRLVERAAALTQELHLVLLPTNAAMREVLKQGRAVKPDFHVTRDYVHPTEAGHLAIAKGMLRGLGEEDAARLLETQRLVPVLQKAALATHLPAEMIPLELPGSFPHRFYFAPDDHSPWESDRLYLQENTMDTDVESEFPVLKSFRPRKNLTGYRNHFVDEPLSGRMTSPVLWRVAAGLMRGKAWKDGGKTFDPALAHGPVEDAIEQGRIFDEPVYLEGGAPLEWHTYQSSVDFTGGNAPGSVDFAAITHARPFEGGCAARLIRSERRRSVNLDLGTQAFAGTMHLTVYLNGQTVYSGLITSEPRKRKTVEATLRQGWNVLAFTLDHTTWQMQCSVEVTPVRGDSFGLLIDSIA